MLFRSKNLLSVSRFASDNHVYFEFHADVCLVKRQGTNEILLQGKLKDGLYMFISLVQTAPYSAHNTAITASSCAYHLWHSRFGHAQPRVIHQIMKICNIHFTAKRESCETIYSKPLQLVFIYIWGSSATPATNGATYYISFVDAYTRYVWFYLIHAKSQALTVFKSFKLYVEKQTSFPLLSIQTNNAKEFLCFKSFLLSNDISHRLTCPYTHEQNGSIERKHRHIVDIGFTLLACSKLPKPFWGYAFTTVVSIINVLPTFVLNNQSPYYLLFNSHPDYSFYKTFGCACYPLLRPYNKHKMSFRSSLCVFLGYVLQRLHVSFSHWTYVYYSSCYF